MSAKDQFRDIDINEGNYSEYIKGNYYQNTYILTINLPQQKLGFPHNVPRSNTEKFVGRQNELFNLYKQLQNEGNAIIAHIEGMGGIGKTELAIVYSLISLDKNTYPGGICWLRCREENIGLKIVEFARTKLNLNPPEDLELKAKVDWCWTNWKEGNTLIVLDDVTDYDSIRSYLPPQSSQFKILITTRLKLESSNTLYLDVLSGEKALELLSELVGSEKVNQELGTAQELCQRLGYLPLALQLVGRYIKRRRISLSEELRRLEGKGLAHPSMKVPKDKSTWAIDIERGVAAAFELSWEELTEAAQELGCLLSLFALAPIPWFLVEISTDGQDSEELENFRAELEKLHLLQVGENYQLHQLIQEFFRDKQKSLTNAEEQKSNLCIAVAEVARKIPYALTLNDVNEFAPFIPHLAKTTTLYQNSLSDKDLISPFGGLGDFYESQGAYEQALTWREQSLFVNKKRFGKDHINVANSLNNLANNYDDQGRYDKAETLQIQALELYKKLLGKEHHEVAGSLNNLAVIYNKQGRYDKAEPLYVQALELYKKLLREEHPNIASILNNLANLYDAQGRYDKAETLYIQSLELKKKLLGEEHLSVARSLNNLAVFYNKQGRYDKAETLYVQALELKKKLLGEEHPSVAISLDNLASNYSGQGGYDKAEPLHIEVLELRKKLLGEEHPDVARSLSNLANLYNKQGRYDKAEPLHIQALELRKKLLGEEHPYVARSLSNLAVLYNKQGRYDKAEPLHIQALELRKKLLGEEHHYVADSLNNLANLYNKQGRYDKAEPLYIQALKIAEAALGENHPDTNLYKNNLQTLLDQMNKKD